MIFMSGLCFDNLEQIVVVVSYDVEKEIKKNRLTMWFKI